MRPASLTRTAKGRVQRKATIWSTNMKIPMWLQTRLYSWAMQKLLLTEPSVKIGNPSDPYLLRWWIIPRNRFFNIYLHHILRSDDDRALHDHPWWNVSLVVGGGYTECIPTDRTNLVYRKVWRGPSSVVARRPSAAHRLEVPSGKPAVTLFITGPRVREWGFWCPQGWKPWQRFTSFAETGNSYLPGPGCGD
jgi:hypothetical protein